MDVLSVSEAWAIAQEIFGEAVVYESSTSYYSSVAQLMEAQGWTAVTKGSEVLYYTKPAQAALTSGVKTYTQVAEVTDVVLAESGSISSVSASTVGVGVQVAEGAIACALAACLGYNVGNLIYESNPVWFDETLSDINEWVVENVPEGGVNGIVTVLNGVDTVLTLPHSLINKFKAHSISSGIYDSTSNVIIPNKNVTINELSLANVNTSVLKLLCNELIALAASTPKYNNIADALITLRNNLDYFVNYVYQQMQNYPDYDVVEIYINIDDTYYRGLDIYIRCCPKSLLTEQFVYYSSVNNSVYRDGYAISMPCTWMMTCNNSGSISDISFISNYACALWIGARNIDILGDLYNSNINHVYTTGIEGTSLQDNATYPSSDVPISETYPNWWNRKKSIGNGEGGSTDWLPVSIPSVDPNTLGNPQTQEQAQSGNNTDKEDNPNIEVADNSGVSDKDNNPDSTDSGDTPIVAPLTSLYGIAGIYNPTLAQITSFSNWLWSENPITQLQQMFSNPMNAIIGLHLIYVTPSTSGEKTIGVGYLDSGIPSKVVNEQYITIDCGTITIPSYYNNVNDWNPYTKISCYLPFIGIVKLNTDDLMSSDGNFSQLNITYKVDVLTGACLAMLKVKRGNSDAVLYQYNGSCSVQLPLTSGNYGSVIASLITTAVGVVSGFAPLAIGGAMGLTHPKADIQRSGQLGANVGAMGIKKPYLIIERPYSKYAGSYSKHIGYPSNNTIKLSACSGFTRVKSTDVNNINATDEERKMILNLLTDGIYI